MIWKYLKLLGFCSEGEPTEMSVVMENGAWIEKLSQSEIEDTCLQDWTCFLPFYGTPPPTVTNQCWLGNLADQSDAQNLLTEDASLVSLDPKLDHYFHLLLQHMCLPQSILSTLPAAEMASISPEDNHQGWLWQKEAPSSSPDGLLFSHYIASALNNALNQFNATLQDLPYRFSFHLKTGNRSWMLQFWRKQGSLMWRRCGQSS